MSCFREDALSGQHIVISGGCGALGVPVIRALVEHGARVSVNDLLAESEAESRLSAAGFPRGVFDTSAATSPKRIWRLASLRTLTENLVPSTPLCVMPAWSCRVVWSTSARKTGTGRCP
jgi:NAD(P)-dependent dehydrogenase (short-subunit alcohol dehydrogenase family)